MNISNLNETKIQKILTIFRETIPFEQSKWMDTWKQEKEREKNSRNWFLMRVNRINRITIDGMVDKMVQQTGEQNYKTNCKNKF